MKIKKIMILSIAFCSLMTIGKVSAQISESQLGFFIETGNFKTCVLEAYNEKYTGLDEVAASQGDIQGRLAQITEFRCRDKDLMSVEGIQYLTGLKTLDLYNNNLREIDLSKNTALKTLELGNNNLNTINLSKNTALIDLSLNHNNLSTINLNKNMALTKLSLNDNNLREIDLSKNIVLTDLRLNGNKLNTIDLSKNTALTNLNLSNNKLNTIDLSNNTALIRLGLENNNFSITTGTKYNLGKVIVGEKLSFKEYVKFPDGFKTKLSYTSSNPEIATVDQNGNISGLKEGTTTITLTSKDINGNLIYEVNEVTITKKAVVSSTSDKANNENSKVKNPETSDKGLIYGGGLVLTIGTIIAIRKKLKVLGI